MDNCHKPIGFGNSTTESSDSVVMNKVMAHLLEPVKVKGRSQSVAIYDLKELK
jgi:hypothetical protein